MPTIIVRLSHASTTKSRLICLLLSGVIGYNLCMTIIRIDLVYYSSYSAAYVTPVTTMALFRKSQTFKPSSLSSPGATYSGGIAKTR
ncbi:hypothetical protein M405DRAFT_142921 [Rhizopogon salebrosus TDB-379]|nr:hypothetical protein M405DRAFT_142921 [Rhizopogon salebrosus TDB-379]